MSQRRLEDWMQGMKAEEGNGSSLERSAEKLSRLFAVDALRGLIIVFMALDHANHFIAQTHSPGEYFGGAFPVFYDPLAFLTRFVAQLCAPGFFFLMGAGMVLFANSRRESGWDERRLVRHFWIRGLVLIALQLLIVNRAWELSPGGWGVDWYVGVLSALGGGLILGSLLFESYFGIPGLGDLMLTSIQDRNEPILSGMVFLTTLIYTVGILVTDLSYAVFDPRIRLR